jgi:hypothetical protein
LFSSGAQRKSPSWTSTSDLMIREDDLMRLIRHTIAGTGIIPARIWLQLSQENKARVREMMDDDA